jgi:hypothetical protein
MPTKRQKPEIKLHPFVLEFICFLRKPAGKSADWVTAQNSPQHWEVSGEVFVYVYISCLAEQLKNNAFYIQRLAITRRSLGKNRRRMGKEKSIRKL